MHENKNFGIKYLSDFVVWILNTRMSDELEHWSVLDTEQNTVIYIVVLFICYKSYLNAVSCLLIVKVKGIYSRKSNYSRFKCTACI